MRLFPILTAIVVISVLYLLVFERDWLLSFAGREPVEDTATTEMASDTDSAADVASDAVAVVAVQSAASVVDSAVIVRGRTEAARQVDVRAETSGLVISEPLR